MTMTKTLRKIAIAVAALGVVLSLVPAAAGLGTCDEDDNCSCHKVLVAHYSRDGGGLKVESQTVCFAVPDPIH
jgi:hypothetical protein